MNPDLPELEEAAVSQIPALLQLVNLGYTYLPRAGGPGDGGVDRWTAGFPTTEISGFHRARKTTRSMSVPSLSSAKVPVVMALRAGGRTLSFLSMASRLR